MSTITMVPIDHIDPHPSNPRRELGDLAELAKSITAQGVRQNLLLVPYCAGCPDVDQSGLRADPWRCAIHADKPVRYRAVIGHRRHAAAKLAKLDRVPAVVDASLTEAQQIELMLLENVQRSDLSPVEEAEGYQELLDLGVTVAAIAKSTGRKPAAIRARVGLLSLPEEAREKVHTGQASLLDAAKLEKLADHPDHQARVAAHLGTASFDQQVASALQQIRWEAERAELVAIIEAAGATKIESNSGDKGLLIARIDHPEDLDGVEIPAGAVYVTSTWSAGVWLHGPKGDREWNESEKARQEGVSAAETEKRLRHLALCEQVTDTRSEWIRGYVAGKVSAAHRSLIVAACARWAAINWVSVYQLAGWLGLDSRSTSAELEREIDASATWSKVDPVCWLLIARHAARNGWPEGDLGLLDLLEALGYVASADELALVRPAAGELAE